MSSKADRLPDYRFYLDLDTDLVYRLSVQRYLLCLLSHLLFAPKEINFKRGRNYATLYTMWLQEGNSCMTTAKKNIKHKKVTTPTIKVFFI